MKNISCRNSFLPWSRLGNRAVLRPALFDYQSERHCSKTNTPASQFQDGTITHNHPSGSPIFSVADIATPAVYQMDGGTLNGIRATTDKNGTFYISATSSRPDWNGLATAYEKAKRGNVSLVKSTGQKRIQNHADWFTKNAGKYGFAFIWER